MLYDSNNKAQLKEWPKYTNSPHEWYQLGLNKTKSILWNGGVGGQIEKDELKSLKSITESPYIFVVGRESNCVDWVDIRDNIYVWDSTFSDHPRFTSYFWWFGGVVEVEKHNSFIDKLVPNHSKSNNLLFDCLLGCKKNHRNHVYDTIKSDTDLNAKSYLTYFGRDGSWQNGNPLDTDMADVVTQTCVPRSYRNDFPTMTMNVSCFLPYEIYNETFYTIVTETRDNITFLTEKTAKPLLAKRLFINVGAYNTLKKMQEFGFKTFSDVIDESYDDEPDYKKRWSMAMQQVKYLSTQDPYMITEKIKSIVEHNKNWLLEKCNYEIAYQQIKGIV
jgi:predicted CopG family antitoxin